MKAKRRAVTSSPRVAEQKYPSAAKRPPTSIVMGAASPPASIRAETRAPVAAGGRRPVGRDRARAGPAEPDPRRIGHVRLRRRIRRCRRRRPARRDLLQGDDAQGADRQPDAAGDRDAGRDAQLDRAPEPGRRRGRRQVRRHLGDLGVPGPGQRRGRIGPRLRRGRPATRRRPGRGRHRAQHLVPERRRRRAPVRHRRGGGRRGHRGGAARDRRCHCWSSSRRTSPTSGRSPAPSPTPARTH